MLIIGESINGTIPRVGQAILDRDETFVQELAQIQVQLGAEMLDVNAGVGGSNEVEDLTWVVNMIQKKVSVPLVIDSSNPEGIKAALSVYRHDEKPMINSISGEKAKRNTLFPIVSEGKCKIVVLCMGDQGIPENVEGRLDIASALFKDLTEAGISPQDIFFDPLVLSVGIDTQTATVTLEALRSIRQHFPESHTICGMSNVGVGLPGRRLINRVFLALAVAAGLDTFLVDVRDRSLISCLYAAKLLTNQDPYALTYIKAFREKKLEV